MKNNILSIAILMAISSSAFVNANDDVHQKHTEHEIETIKVWGQSKKKQ